MKKQGVAYPPSQQTMQEAGECGFDRRSMVRLVLYGSSIGAKWTLSMRSGFFSPNDSGGILE